MKVYTDQKKLTDTESKEASKIDLRNEIQEEHRTHPAPWFRWVLARLKLADLAHILEIGCGSGAMWQENQDRLSPGWQIFLTDLSRGIVKTAHNNLADLNQASSFLTLDSQSMPFGKENFDAVLAIGVLDQVPDLNQALSEAWRVLRPPGLLLASAGGREHLREMRVMLAPYLPGEKADLLGGEEERFGLENGQQKLSVFFDQVERFDYNDTMQFTELQPILDYVLSEESIVWDMRLHHLSQFVWDLKRKLAEDGVIEVTVQKCLFTARKQFIRPRR
jgi:ubiquinone/menaquinone biosynthesis C-methylase UbiE